jgi:hypothetical protein
MPINLRKFKLFVCVLFLIEKISSVSGAYLPLDSPESSKMSMREYFTEFLLKFSNETNIKDFNGTCEAKFNEVFDNSEDLTDLWFMSGQFLNDWGNYIDCVKKDRLYIQFRFNITINQSMKTNNYIGVCFIKECKNFTEQILKSNGPGNFVNFLKNNYNISINPSETKFYTIQDHKGKTKKPIYLGFKIFLFVILLYFVLKFAISFLGFIIFRKKFSKYSDSFRNQITLSGNNFNKNLKSVTYKIYIILSFRKALRYLVKQKTRIYNDNDIDKFLYIKYISLLGINFYTLFISFIGRIYELEKMNFKDINYMFVLKLSYYSFNLYTLIVGLIFSYKLLSYIANNKDTSLKAFLKFYVIALSRFFVYFISALVVIYFSKDIFNYFGNLNIVNDSYNGMFKSSYDCFIEPLHMVIPFYMNYHNRYEKKNFLVTSQCNSTFLLLSSEFYIFTICTFLFYLVYKFKNKKFEIFLCIMPFILLLLLFLRYSNPDDTYSNAEIIFAIRKVLKPHSLFVTYFLGIIIGVIFFINIKTQVLVDDSVYIPFEFFKKVNIYLNKKPVWVLTIWSYIFIFFAILISCNFEIIKALYKNNTDETFEVPFDILLNIIYIFEHKIFIIFIGLYVILFIHRQNHSDKKEFFTFIAISRSSYCIILASEFISNLLYMKILAYENINITLNLLKILLFLFGNFLLSSFIGIFMQISFETPLRILIKKSKTTKRRLAENSINSS